jgi:ABC-2 type transport system ATP-binding protein
VKRQAKMRLSGSAPPAAPGAVANLEGVTHRFGAVTALDGISLSINRGETVALLGPNGAGKTTAVEILLGLTTPDSGVVRLFGGAPADAVAAGGVGAMLQDAGLPQGVTVAEIIDLIRGLYRDPLPLEEVLRLSDLDGAARRQVQRLSGGQRQRVRLALALAGNPDFVLLDEPTAALDVEARRLFWEGVRASVSTGRTILFATHRLEEADTVADRVVVIANGRLVADGTPDEVKAQALGRSAVRFTPNGGPAREVLERLPAVESLEANGRRLTLYTTDPDLTVRALLHEVPHVSDLEVTRSGLEAAFLSLTQQGASR